MEIVVDNSGIVAIFDKDTASQRAVMEAVNRTMATLIVPTGILAEVDYMLATRLGNKAVDSFLESVEVGFFELEPLLVDDVTRCRALMSDYLDMDFGLADAAVMTTAERLQVQTILTFDERHFRAVRPRVFTHFILYPADYPHES